MVKINDNQVKDFLGLVVGVGASAGGLEAMLSLFTTIPKDCGLTFVVIHHTDPRHASALADVLRPCTALTVGAAKDGIQLLPNHIYTIPSDRDLIIEGDVLRLVPRTLGASKNWRGTNRSLFFTGAVCWSGDSFSFWRCVFKLAIAWRQHAYGHRGLAPSVRAA